MKKKLFRLMAAAAIILTAACAKPEERPDYIYDDETRLVITDALLEKTVTIDKTKSNTYINRHTSDGYRLDGYGIIEGDTVSVSYAKGDVELYSLYITKGSKSDSFITLDENKLISKDYTYTVSNTLLQKYPDISKIVTFNEEYEVYVDHRGKIAGFSSKQTGYDSYYKIIKNKDEFIYIYNAVNSSFIFFGKPVGGGIEAGYYAYRPARFF